MVWYDSTGLGTAGSLFAFNGSSWSAVGGSAASQSSSSELSNLSLSTAVSGNQLTVELKNKDGNDPSFGSPVTISFRRDTASNGSYTMATVTGAVSLTISSGSNLGMSSGIAGYLYVYAINNAGTVELAIVNGLRDEGSLQDSTAEGGSGGGGSAGGIHAAGARPRKTGGLLRRLNNVETTAGTWASNATEISVAPFAKTFTLPATASSSNGLVNYSTTGIAAGQFGDLTSITLQPGEYDWTLALQYVSNGATTTSTVGGGISMVSGNSSSGLIQGQTALYTEKSTTNTTYNGVSLSGMGLVVSSPTTYYLKSLAGNSTTNLQIGWSWKFRKIK